MRFDCVFDRFVKLADIDSDEASKWTYLVHDCIYDVAEMLSPDSDTDENSHRLNAVASALALYRYRNILCARGEFSGGKLGDVTVNADENSVQASYAIYCEELSRIADILKSDSVYYDDFVFGRTESLCTENP